MKNGTMKKYLEQKRWSIPEKVTLAVAVVGAYLANFVWWGTYVGNPLFVISIVVLAFLKTQKVKDDEMDATLNKWIQYDMDPRDLRKSLQTYNLRAEPVKRGKDGKLRSASYVILKVEFANETETAQLSVWRFDLINETLTKEDYKVTPGELSFVEESISVSGTRKTAAFLDSDAFSAPIPIDTNDHNADTAVKRLCGFET